MSAYFELKEEEIEKLVKKINKLDEKVKCYLVNNNGSWFCMTFYIGMVQYLAITVYQDKRIFINYGDDIIDEFDEMKETLNYLKDCLADRIYMSIYLIKYLDKIYKYCYSILD